VLLFLAAAAVAAALIVSIAPALRMIRTDPARATRGELSLNARRSRLRSGLVAAQVAASVLFLVGTVGVITQFKRAAHIDPGIRYERVTSIGVDAPLRSALTTRLASDPSVDAVAVAWRAPLIGGGALPTIQARASTSGVSTPVGFMAVSPEYFALFGIDITAGRPFTADEAREAAPVVRGSAARARALRPQTSAIGETLELTPAPDARAGRRPPYTSVRVIGVTEDVTNSSPFDGHDGTCVYFVTDARQPGDMAVLVRGR